MQRKKKIDDKILKNKKGYTLVEMLVYVVILGIIMVVVIGVFLTISRTNSRVVSLIEINSNAYSAMERMIYEVSNARNIYMPTSNFINYNSSGKITAIAITNSGSGYTSAPTVFITGGGGLNAVAVASIASGKITAIAITNSGSGYTSAPTVSFAGGGGSGAAAVVAPQLSLATQQAVSANESTAYLDFYLENNTIFMKQDGASPIALTSENVQVESLSLYYYKNDSRESVKIDFTIKPNNILNSGVKIDLSTVVALRS